MQTQHSNLLVVCAHPVENSHYDVLVQYFPWGVARTLAQQRWLSCIDLSDLELYLTNITERVELSACS